MDSMIGKTIGRYQILDELGQGGMAIVFKAMDTVLERNVAIKMILPGQQQSDKFLKRFQRESRTLAQLSHSNIVKVLDFGEYEGTPYLVMEFIPGGSLSDRMGKAFSCQEAAAILAPVARALHTAHQHKVIHRDVKPANILINESGQATLSDFGIVKLIDAEEGQTLTGTGVMVGTPSYMAPEQITGGQIDGRTDLYALGAIFFELVTGRKPYTAKTPIEITLKHLNDPVPRPRQFVRDLPAEADQIVMKTMAKDPAERYPSMEAFAQVLERLAQGQQVVGRVTGHSIETAKPEKEKAATEQAAPARTGMPKKTLFFVGGGILALVALAVSIFFFVQGPGMGTPTMAVAGVKVTEAQATPEVNATATEMAVEPLVTATTAPTITETVAVTPTEAVTATPSEATAAPTPAPSSGIGLEDLSTVVELSRIEKISVIQLDWSSDGLWIVDAGSKALNIIDPVTMKSVGTINLGNEVPKNLAISSDSKKVITLLSNTVKMFDLASRKEERSFAIQGGANSMALSQDSSLIALGLSDNKVLLLNAENGSVTRTLRSNYGGWSVAFSPDGKYVAVGTSQGTLMWETATGTWLPIATGQDLLIKKVAFSNNGKYLAGGSDGIIFIWDVETGSEVAKLTGLFGTINSLDFSPDDALLLTASTDKIVRIWDLEAKKEAMQYKNHTSAVFSAVFSPKGDYFVSGANEGVIRLWGLP